VTVIMISVSSEGKYAFFFALPTLFTRRCSINNSTASMDSRNYLLGMVRSSNSQISTCSTEAVFKSKTQ
jgi:hypothetical protein